MPADHSSRLANPLQAPQWEGRVAVVSPHFDDAVLSLGASIRAARRRGAQVDAVTVLSGDTESAAAADESIRRAGFASAGEASRARRAEDHVACRLVGADPIWLPFADNDNEPPPSDEEIRSELRQRLEGYDAVLLPGCPLHHPDHRSISRLTLEALGPGRRIGLYVEQPYAAWRALSRSGRSSRELQCAQSLQQLRLEVEPAGRWLRGPGGPADWLVKQKAIGLYRSQVRVLRKFPRTRIFVDEARHGGEAVLWCTLT